MKDLVIKILKNALDKKGVKLTEEKIDGLIEIPSNPEHGDFAFPCFFLAGMLKDNPATIAKEVMENMGEFPETDFESIDTQGPYINFFMNRKSLARQTVWDVILKKKDYGKLKIGQGKKVVAEFSSVNIAKPFGIGHLRSTIIGNSLSNILEFQGYKVARINYLGDWGTQFGKLIFGFKKWGNDKKLDKDPIKHLLEIYVKANKDSYEDKGREEFKKLEDGNRENLMLWRRFRELSLREFEKIYDFLGIKFDEYSGESLYNKKAVDALEELQKKKLVEESKGALIVNLEKYGLSNAIIQKSDGATIYLGRDIAAAIDRYKKYNFSSMFYEVGQEQSLHFKQLFKILELMGYKWAKECSHIGHGLYLDHDGKKFSTRKGKIFLLEDLIEETLDLVKKELKKRGKKISKKELEERARKIAVAAIFYGDLKSNRENSTVFDLEKFSSFDGNTGPYLLYSYARASSILKKAPEPKKFEIGEMEEKEIDLVKKLASFTAVVYDAGRTMNPSIIANYSYQLAQSFNEFYQNCKVIGSDEEPFRLALVQAFRQVLKNSLWLLGIETIEEM